jgi:hypothetical protein
LVPICLHIPLLHGFGRHGSSLNKN